MVSSLNSVPANVLERSQSLVLPALTSPDHGKVPGAVVSQDLLALQVQDGHFHSQSCAALCCRAEGLWLYQEWDLLLLLSLARATEHQPEEQG